MLSLSRIRGGVLLVLILSWLCGPPSDAFAQKPSKPKPRPSPTSKTAPTPTPEKAPEPQQWKAVMRYTTGGEESTTTVYAAGERQRVDLGNGASMITQCDARRLLQINEQARAYTSVPFAADAAPPAPVEAATPPPKGGVVTVRVVATDTGERREIFGQQARHVRIVTTTEPDPQACNEKKTRVETDGWYAELADLQTCAPAAVLTAPTGREDCVDRQLVEVTGNPSPGYPLAYTMTAFEDENEVSRLVAEVTSLAQEPRVPELFEPPDGFTAAPDADALAALARRAELEALGTTPKQAGMIRVGVVAPADASGRDMAMDAAAGELFEAFSDAPFEAVPISASIAQDQIVEAARKECDFVLRGELAQVTSSKPSRMGGLVRRASGGGAPSELHEAKVMLEVVSVKAETPPRKATASAKTGAFTWRRAVGIARFAGRLYVGMTAGVMSKVISGGRGGMLSGADPTVQAINMLLGTRQEEDEQAPDTAVAAAFNKAAENVKTALRKASPER